MNQQSFANFIGVSPASLSSILQERTRPTLNIVEAIRSKMPNLNTDWLMWGEGEMFQPGSTDAVKEPGSLFGDDPLAGTDSKTLDLGQPADGTLFGRSECFAAHLPAAASRCFVISC